MRAVRSLSGLFLALAAALFAVDNRQDVSLGFFPLDGRIELPTYVAALVPLAVGLVAGWVLRWRSGGTERSRSRRLGRERARLQRELDEARKGAEGNAVVTAAS